MIETTQSVFNANGEVTARKIVKAAKGRCIGAHFGTYDYTASCDLIAAYQTMDSAVCDFARDVMKVAFGGFRNFSFRWRNQYHACCSA